MRPSIRTEHPRTLLLENVVRRRVGSLDAREVRDTAVALARDIRDNGGTPVGPLIQRLTPGEPTDGAATPETVLMRQSETPLDVHVHVPAPGVEVEQRIEVPGCVLVQFCGDASDLDVVYSQLRVYAFENGIELDGTVYLVFVGDEGMSIAVDAFATTRDAGGDASR